MDKKPAINNLGNTSVASIQIVVLRVIWPQYLTLPLMQRELGHYTWMQTCSAQGAKAKG